MALGDGIRRNILAVSAAKRQRFVFELVKLNSHFYPGSRTDFPAGGVTYWFKMDEIHQATHVHGGAAFLPWHRELCNYFETLLRQIELDLSLHYWDWTQDISPLFPLFGDMNGQAGKPWLRANFYNLTAADDKWRDEAVHGNPFTPTWTGSYALHANPADPPKDRARNVQSGTPPTGTPNWPGDAQFTGAATFSDFDSLMQGPAANAHSAAHRWLGLGNAHTSFRDPIVFLLHSNVDRLWATWQTQSGHADRLDPAKVYGVLGTNLEINQPLQPLADPSLVHPGKRPGRQDQQARRGGVTTLLRHAGDLPAGGHADDPCHPVQRRACRRNGGPRRSIFRPLLRQGASEHHACTHRAKRPARHRVRHLPAATGTTVTIPNISSNTPPSGRLWISYRGTVAGDVASGTVTVHFDETGQDFIIPITANTIARPSVAVILVLDQSGSMGWLASTPAPSASTCCTRPPPSSCNWPKAAAGLATVRAWSASTIWPTRGRT